MSLVAFIEQNAADLIITGGVSGERIMEMETELALCFRQEYRKFLARYGMLLGFGVMILGCGKGAEASVVTETKRFREMGLSDQYIVIRDVDEWIYCLNNNDGTVSSWDRGSRKHLPVSPDFDSYVLKELTEAKEDWD